MLNIRTLSGIMLCIFGVLLAKLKSFDLGFGEIFLMSSYCTGILVSFFGLSVFMSGLKSRVSVKVRVCPNCFYKNEAEETICRKCKNPIL